LDGIRAVAILAVFAFHSGTRLHGAFIGVDIFFVLSGFLITTLLLQEWRDTGAIAMGDFYRRRAARLLPALFVTVAAVSVIYAVDRQLDLQTDLGFVGSVLAVIFYSSNWFTAMNFNAVPALFNHTWSLAIEEQFYLVWPPLLLLCLWRRWPPRRLLVLAVTLAGASAILRFILWNAHRGGNTYFRSDTRADGLLLGCALAIVFGTHRGRSLLTRYLGRPLALAAGATLLVFAIQAAPRDPLVYKGGLFGVVVCSAAVIAHVVCADRSWLTRLLAVRPLVWVGARSYGMYLFHIPVFAVIGASWLGDQPSRFVVPLQIAVTMLLAAASYRWIESYFMRRRRLRGAPPHVQRAPAERGIEPSSPRLSEARTT
jgi:peptidoglycan/LPS O-acetylase OafA/YrhL